ncbi:lipopolysaccharide biosynthesis protein RfbH [Magnetovibrio sp.]|uniref:lipopolysaccharide biosynthesis protein RfbH n=1 Tax=Magnetovibrio sp. TaxID=2024836 RepID=UPI002F923774
MTHSSPKKEQIRAQIAALVEEYAAEEFKQKAFEPGATAVPPSGKLLGAQELKNLVDASLDAWLTTGRFNAEFEANLAKFLGVKHVMTTNSGSSANLLALAALTSPNLGDKALKPGDEVISVAAGFPTTVNPLLQYGLVPVFVDIDIPTYNIDPTAIEAAISDKTRAIMLAHTLGNPFDLETVMRLAHKHDLWVIEDTCDALGSTYTPSAPLERNRDKIIAADKPRLVGTFGDVATLSFYPAHHITMGEGGAVYTNSGKLKPIIESFRDWGRDCFCAPGRDNTCGKRFCWQLGNMPEGYDHKYIYSHAGYNMKITDMQAACGVAQLDRIDDFVAARKANFAYLYAGLKCCEEFLILPEATPNSSPSWFGFTLTLRDSAPLSRIELLRKLEERKIGTRLLFAGNITCQPYMAGRNFRVSGSLENTDLVMNNTFWVGVQPALTKEMLDYLIDTIKGSFNVA